MSVTVLAPLSAGAALGLIAAAAAGVLALRWMLGPANAVSRQWGLWFLRGAIVLIVAIVLLNPVRVDQLPGPVQRPEVFYLLDTSASMQMGEPRSRWEESLRMIRQAQNL